VEVPDGEQPGREPEEADGPVLLDSHSFHGGLV
jgi:hypothetical protein